MNKNVYVLTDGSGEIFDARFMDQGDYENEQRKASEATDGEYGWLLAEVYYTAALGSKGGSSTSEAKRQASAANGRKGGRPKKIQE